MIYHLSTGQCGETDMKIYISCCNVGIKLSGANGIEQNNPRSLFARRAFRQMLNVMFK